jgi:hypothetical protein
MSPILIPAVIAIVATVYFVITSGNSTFVDLETVRDVSVHAAVQVAELSTQTTENVIHIPERMRVNPSRDADVAYLQRVIVERELEGEAGDESNLTRIINNIRRTDMSRTYLQPYRSAAELAAYVETLPPLPPDDAGSDEDAVAFPQAGSIGTEDVSAASESRDSVFTIPTTTAHSDEEPGGQR